MKNPVFWAAAPCTLVKFTEAMAPMMEAAGISETSTNFYHSTRRNNPENRHLHINN
jgi:hypothetical protein